MGLAPSRRFMKSDTPGMVDTYGRPPLFSRKQERIGRRVAMAKRTGRREGKGNPENQQSGQMENCMVMT